MPIDIKKMSPAQLEMAKAMEAVYMQVFDMIEHYGNGGGRVSPDGIAGEAIATLLKELQSVGVTIEGEGVKDTFDSIDGEFIAENFAYIDWDDGTSMVEQDAT